MDASLLLQILEHDGQQRDITTLSGSGIHEQLAIQTRLSFVRQLAKGGRSVPEILDDALVYADDERIERIVDALHYDVDTTFVEIHGCRLIFSASVLLPCAI